jgi:hypothetical protein
VTATTGSRIIIIDPQVDARWTTFVADHPDGLVYHHPAWLQVLERAYGSRLVGLACESEDGRLRGILPLFRTRGVLTGPRLSSLPHTPVAGPLALDPQATADLVRAAVEHTRAAPGTQLQLKTFSAELVPPLDGFVGVPWRATYVLPLPERATELRFGNSRNHTRIKWAVNKAVREGVRVRPAETEADLKAWYQLHLDTVRRHAVPRASYGFFKACWETLRPRGLMQLFLAEQHGQARPRLLAGSIVLMFGRTAFYAFNGRRREALPLRPNDLIQWEAIHYACRNGFRRYDLGEVTEDNHGLADFKSKWASEPRLLYRYYYPAPREVETGALRPDSRARQLASAAWRRLPVTATAVLGKWLYHYL